MRVHLCLSTPKPNVQMMEEIMVDRGRPKLTKDQVALKRALKRIEYLEEQAKERAEIIEKLQLEKYRLADEIATLVLESEETEDRLREEIDILKSGKTL